ncbi:MAG: DUF1987 domain-containing protein [Bacteroidales bacterium]|nr:DUF1987 domain-containing protein [Bacteroidales bacterium]
MENLILEGSDSLPSVQFSIDGNLKISGRALPENAYNFFKPLIAWVKEFCVDELNLEINLEYFNTTVSKQLYDFLKVIEHNNGYKKINVKWFYEDGDDEILESGEIYEELLPRFNFTYHRYAEVFDE